MVFVSPSFSAVFGFQPSSDCAFAISGWRCFGSSCGSGRCAMRDFEPVSERACLPSTAAAGQKLPPRHYFFGRFRRLTGKHAKISGTAFARRLRNHGGSCENPPCRIECNRSFCNESGTARTGRARSACRAPRSRRSAVRKIGIGARAWPATAVGHNGRTPISA